MPRLSEARKDDVNQSTEHSFLLEKCKEINHLSCVEKTNGDSKNQPYLHEMVALSYTPEKNSYHQKGVRQ